jgi:molybdate transport system regulatory protein
VSSRARRSPSGSSSSPGIRFRIDFHDRCSVGIGKITLLEAIARTGSLSQAARVIGMSYRRAWLLIDSMNADFDTPVISATVGGSGGGGAQLTSFGQELVQAYRKLEGCLTSLTTQHMRGVAGHVAGSDGRSTSGGTSLRGRLTRPLKRPASARRDLRK